MKILVVLASIIFAGAAIAFLPWQLTKQKKRWASLRTEGGNLLLDLGRQALSPGLILVLLWGFATFIWTLASLIWLLRTEDIPGWDLIPILLFPFAFLLMFLYLLSVDWRQLEAREHGIFDSRMILLWKDIHSYEWKGRKKNVLYLWIRSDSEIAPRLFNPVKLYISATKKDDLQSILTEHVPNDTAA